MRGQYLPAWNPGHTGLVPIDNFGASWVTLGEELAGRGHEVGIYPTVRAGDVGGFRIIGSVVRVAPLSNALRGGGGGPISGQLGYTGS